MPLGPSVPQYLVDHLLFTSNHFHTEWREISADENQPISSVALAGFSSAARPYFSLKLIEEEILCVVSVWQNLFISSECFQLPNVSY